MAGRIIRILPRTSYTYTTLATSGTATVEVAQRIDVTGWEEATLIARLHPGSTFAASNTVAVNVVGDGFTPDDPSILFQSSNLATYTFNTSILSTATSGNLQIVPVKGDGTNRGYFGGLLSVTLVFTQVTGASTLTPIISIDLSVKNPG